MTSSRCVPVRDTYPLQRSTRRDGTQPTPYPTIGPIPSSRFRHVSKLEIAKTKTTCSQDFASFCSSRSPDIVMALKASVMLLVLTATATHCCTKFQIQSYNCGYNSTKYGGSSTYPNPVVDNLGNAFVHLDSLEAILDTGCSRTTEQFGCSALLPNCADGLGPCRSLCETFLQDCAQEIIQHQQTVLVLQDMFNCSR